MSLSVVWKQQTLGVPDAKPSSSNNLGNYPTELKLSEISISTLSVIAIVQRIVISSYQYDILK